jgi:hypothetical protein
MGFSLHVWTEMLPVPFRSEPIGDVHSCSHNCGHTLYKCALGTFSGLQQEGAYAALQYRQASQCSLLPSVYIDRLFGKNSAS